MSTIKITQKFRVLIGQLNSLFAIQFHNNAEVYFWQYFVDISITERRKVGRPWQRRWHLANSQRFREYWHVTWNFFIATLKPSSPYTDPKSQQICIIFSARGEVKWFESKKCFATTRQSRFFSEGINKTPPFGRGSVAFTTPPQKHLQSGVEPFCLDIIILNYPNVKPIIKYAVSYPSSE